MKWVSLGRNCEVSFQIQKYVGDEWESSLFSWAYILDDSLLIPALNNPEDLFQNEFHFHPPTNDMFLDEKYQITFHGRTPKDEILDENNQIINMEKYNSTVDELRSRIAHLTSKFRANLASDEPTAYIYKLMLYNTEDAYIHEKITFVKDLYAWFQEHKTGSDWKLIIVVEENFAKYFTDLADSNLVIETVSYFAPDSDTLNGADAKNWNRILKLVEKELDPKKKLHKHTSKVLSFLRIKK